MVVIKQRAGQNTDLLTSTWLTPCPPLPDAWRLTKHFRGDGNLSDQTPKVDSVVHEYRRFIQRELEARGWDPAELVRRSGLRRQLIWKILHDDRDRLGQMPDDATLEGIARGLNIPVARVRLAAARSLDGYVGDNAPTVTDVRDVPTDVLLEELRRRIPAHDTADPNEAEHLPRGGRIIRQSAPHKNASVRRNQQSG